MAQARGRDAFFVALATLALAVVLYPGALLRGEAFFERDLHVDWYPRIAALLRCLHAGAWPLWDPGLGFGQPLIADPSLQALYPPTWLALALPWGTAYTAFVLVNLLVAALGTKRLAARLGAGRAGAWTAGLAFALSGPMQSSVNLWTHFAGAATMPWVLLAFDTAARRPANGPTLGLAVALAVQLLAGSPDACAITYALALALVVARLVATRSIRRRGGRPGLGLRLAGLAAGIALAGALTCVVWWPTAEAVLGSSRRALPEEVRTAWSVPSLGLSRIAVPLDPARVPFDPGRWTRLYDRPVQPLLYSLYLGVPTLGLAFASLFARRRRGRALALAAAVALVVAFAMGPHAPLYDPLSAMFPPLRALRFPSKAMLPAALVVAVLAGLGVRALSSARARLASAAVVLLGSAAIGLAATRLAVPMAPSLWLGLAFAAVLAVHGARLAPRLATAALVVLAACDLLMAHRDLNATLPAALLVERPAVLSFLHTEDGSRVHVWDYSTEPESSQRLLGTSDPYQPVGAPSGLDSRVLAFAAQRQLLAPLTANFFGLETSYDFDRRGLAPRAMNDLTYFLDHVQGTAVHARLLRLGAVARVVALHEPGERELRLARVLPSLAPEPLRVFEVKDPLPRARLVGRTRIADGEAAFRALSEPAFDPGVEALVASGEPLGTEAFQGSLIWLERRPDRQRLETTSSGPGLLVLADAYDPGWRASLDGAPVPVLRTNVAFRGVAVPEGRHSVDLVYRPRSAVWGLALSVAALVVTAVLFVVGRRSGARPRRPSL
jgi:Bacterial membrane protein YfhO